MYGGSLFIRSKLARNDIEKYLAESPSYLIFRSIILVHNNLVLLIICNEATHGLSRPIDSPWSLLRTF